MLGFIVVFETFDNSKIVIKNEIEVSFYKNNCERKEN